MRKQRGREKYKNCVVCGRKFKREELSKRGLCFECSTKRALENIKSLKSKRGRHYEKWKQGFLRFAEKLKGED